MAIYFGKGFTDWHEIWQSDMPIFDEAFFKIMRPLILHYKGDLPTSKLVLCCIVYHICRLASWF